MPQHFKSDDSLSPRENVEGHHSGVHLYSNCLLYAVGSSIGGMDLVSHVAGEYSRGLVVVDTTACIRLI